MRKEILLHFTSWFGFFILVALFHKYFSLSTWPFWLGGIVGTLLPDIDHILYLYLRPNEYNSQRVGYMIGKREIKDTFKFLYETRSERKDLIFHTAFFQLIFIVLSFLVLSSSGSIFAKGMVLAFLLHLLVDQAVDIKNVQSFDNWLKYSPLYLDLKNAKKYWWVVASVVILFGVFL